MVDVLTNLGLEPTDAGLTPGVAGARGLCSVLAVVNDGLTVGVYGAVAAAEACEAFDVECWWPCIRGEGTSEYG